MTTTIPTSGPTRAVTVDELADYARDGAAILRGVVPLDWVEAVAAATDRLMATDDVPAMDFAAGVGPRFWTLTYTWRLDPVHRAWALQGPLVELARQVLAPQRALNMFFDQLFVREVGSSKSTPFHQDQPYLPLTGTQILRLWVPLDVVDVENGAVHYLKGSHRGPVYRARSFDEGNAIAGSYDTAADFEPLPDFAASYAEYDWLVGACVPGDVILHHPRTVHGSPAGIAQTARRASTLVYTGDDVRWDPHPANALNNVELMGHEPIPDLTAGGPIDCELFPRVWAG